MSVEQVNVSVIRRQVNTFLAALHIFTSPRGTFSGSPPERPISLRGWGVPHFSRLLRESLP